MEQAIAFVLIAVHYVPLLLALLWWSSRPASSSWPNLIADGLGILSILVAFVTFPVLSDSSGGPYGNGGDWFVIFSKLSLGMLPIVTVGAHVLLGRLLGRAGREGWRLFVQAL